LLLIALLPFPSLTPQQEGEDQWGAGLSHKRHGPRSGTPSLPLFFLRLSIIGKRYGGRLSPPPPLFFLCLALSTWRTTPLRRQSRGRRRLVLSSPFLTALPSARGSNSALFFFPSLLGRGRPRLAERLPFDEFCGRSSPHFSLRNPLKGEIQ